MPGPWSQTVSVTHSPSLSMLTSIGASGGEKEHGIVEQILDHRVRAARPPRGHGRHIRGLKARSGGLRSRRGFSRPPMIARASSARSIFSSVARLISASIRLASEISLTSRSIRRTSCVAISIQFLAQRRTIDPRQRFDRAAQNWRAGSLSRAPRPPRSCRPRRSAGAVRRSYRKPRGASRPISSLRCGRRGTSTSVAALAQLAPQRARAGARGPMVRARNSDSKADAASTSSIAKNPAWVGAPRARFR